MSPATSKVTKCGVACGIRSSADMSSRAGDWICKARGSQGGTKDVLRPGAAGLPWHSAQVCPAPWRQADDINDDLDGGTACRDHVRHEPKAEEPAHPFGSSQTGMRLDAIGVLSVKNSAASGANRNADALSKKARQVPPPRQDGVRLPACHEGPARTSSRRHGQSSHSPAPRHPAG